VQQQNYFKLDIITPHGLVFSDNVIHVRTPGKSGSFGVLVNHISSIILLGIGMVEVQAIQGNRNFTISGGVAKIENNVMKILTQAAEDVDKIDLERAKVAKARAERKLKSKNIKKKIKLHKDLLRAENRLRAANLSQSQRQ
jgi:F-type H+-transporting ATPase subunit epsilon